MSFDLFGFDVVPSDRLCGFWIGSIQIHDDFHRCLFGIYFMDGEMLIDLFYMRYAFS